MDIFPGGWKSSKRFFFFLFVFLLSKGRGKGIVLSRHVNWTKRVDAFGGVGDMEEKFLLLYVTGFASVRRFRLFKLFEIFIRVQWNRMSIAIEGMLQYIYYKNRRNFK